MNVQIILNKNLPWAHIKLEFEVCGFTRMLVKNMWFTCLKIKIKPRIYFPLRKVPKQQIARSGSQGILGV
jgi:hypothetical protein